MCAWIRFYQNKQLWSKQRRGAAKWWRTHQCNLTMCKNIFMHKRFSNFFVFSKNMTSVTWRQFSPDFCDIYSSHLLCSAAQWFLQELHFFPSMKYEGGRRKERLSTVCRERSILEKVRCYRSLFLFTTPPSSSASIKSALGLERCQRLCGKFTEASSRIQITRI